MTVAPLIAMKSTKCESLEAVGKELDRRAHTYDRSPKARAAEAQRAARARDANRDDRPPQRSWSQSR